MPNVPAGVTSLFVKNVYMGPSADESPRSGRGRAKRDEILDAALAVFADYGFARTSMSTIAEEAGVSRGGLYLHFENKEAVYRTMLDRTLTGARDAAFAALDQGDMISDQLDGYLQRGWGDPAVWALTARHGSEMIEAKAGYANDVAAAHNQKIQDATMRFLKRSAPAATEDKIKLWAELLMLAPVGLRYDKPTIETYRQRLTEFATMVAEQVQGSRD